MGSAYSAMMDAAEWEKRVREKYGPTTVIVDSPVRTFDTGATRDTEDGKLDYEGFLCPRVLEKYAEYMHENRLQSDGKLRDSDNWQKGMPRPVYMKSMFRHFMQFWRSHRRGEPDMQALMGVLFNAMGYAHEQIKCDEGF